MTNLYKLQVENESADLTDWYLDNVEDMMKLIELRIKSLTLAHTKYSPADTHLVVFKSE